MPRIAASLCVLLLAAAAAHAQPARSAFHALPENTVLVMRVAQPARVLSLLRERTKFGRVLLAEDRWARVADAAKQQGDEWDRMADDLAKVGLKPEDLPGLFAGEMGYAITIQPRTQKLLESQDQPLMVGLMWAQPGEEAATKIMQAIARGVERARDEQGEHKPRRTDLQIEGHEVMHLAVPSIEVEYSGWEQGELEWEDDFEMQAQRAAALAMQDDGEEIEITTRQTDQTNIYITRIGGRVVMAHTFEQNSAAFDEAGGDEAGRQIDFGKLSAAEQAAGVFARFLAAQRAADMDYAAYVNATPGLADAMPAGESVFELFADARPVWKLLQADADRGDEEAVTAMRYVDQLAINRFSVMGMKSTLDGNAMRINAYLATPAPRTGVHKLFEQPAIQPRPKAWVPAHVTEYGHFSFNLGQAFKHIKAMVIEQMGDTAKQWFDQGDLTAQNMTGADIATVLSSLGHEHVTLRLKSRIAPDADQIAPGDEDRLAMIWKLKDERVWQRVVMAMAPLQMQFGQAMQQASEQGFTGWRLSVPQQMAGALMVGKGHLTLTIGNGVTEEILSVLRNPPAPADALVNSDLLTRANRYLKFRPGIMYSVSDAGRIFSDTLMALRQIVTAETQHAAADDPGKRLLNTVLDLMPSVQELEGALDVGGSQAYLTPAGLVVQSFLVMPQP